MECPGQATLDYKPSVEVSVPTGVRKQEWFACSIQRIKTKLTWVLTLR